MKKQCKDCKYRKKCLSGHLFRTDENILVTLTTGLEDIMPCDHYKRKRWKFWRPK